MHFKGGRHTITVESGKTATISDILTGYTFQVTEDLAADSDNELVSDDIVSGIIGKDEEADFTNREKEKKQEIEDEKPGALTVTKSVVNAGRKPLYNINRAFIFTVTLDDETANGQYGDLEFTNGIAAFTLEAVFTNTMDEESEAEIDNLNSENPEDTKKDNNKLETPDVGPKTGDDSPIILWITTAAVSMAGIMAAVFSLKKDQVR